MFTIIRRCLMRKNVFVLSITEQLFWMEFKILLNKGSLLGAGVLRNPGMYLKGQGPIWR